MNKTYTHPVPIFQVTYDGSRYYGSQLQPSVPTVQKSIEKALQGLTKVKAARISFSGRTDRGVHSTAQVFSIPDGLIPPTKVVAEILNKRLEQFIRITGFADTSTTFCPRGSAISRTYHYILRLEDCANPFKDAYSTPVTEPIDIEKAKEVAAFFIGTHDFTHLTIKPKQQKQLVRIIDNVSITLSKPKVATSERATIVCTSKAFLRRQVRNIVNLIIMGGQSKITCKEIAELLKKERKDRRLKPAPPGGLYLTDIEYEENYFTQFSPFSDITEG